MNNINQIEGILNENNLVLNNTDKVRLILGQDPYSENSYQTIMKNCYPFEVASFVTPFFEEKIQLFCVMNLFFGLDNAKILIEEFKHQSVSGSDFVLFLEKKAQIYFGNVSEEDNLKKFLSKHEDVRILCCGNKAQDNNLLSKVPSQNRFAIVNPSNLTFKNPSTVQAWLLFNHKSSSQIKNIFSLI
ncbi:hypothetical protein [Lactococcus lactis]|uniref:hypothetical protein n=1 Tax=Lactococcus lactis TaxID=1358 RepID=UPI00345D6C5E